MLSKNLSIKSDPRNPSKSSKFHLFFPTSVWGFCFLPCIPPVARPVRRVRVRVPSANNNYYTDLTPLISQLLISHNSSHNYSSHTTHLTTTHLTQLISHTTHLTHNSSHTTHLTQLISHTIHLTQLISHNSSRTIHLTHNSSHTTHFSDNSSHTQLISHNSSHTPHLTDMLLGRRSTQSLLTEVRRGLAPQWPRLAFAWQAQYAELVTGAAARIGAAVAAATCCVAGAVHRASWRSCGADWRRRGRGCLLCSRRST